jgi:hypothetical protein
MGADEQKSLLLFAKITFWREMFLLVNKKWNEVKVDWNEVIKKWNFFDDLRNFIGPESKWTNHKFSVQSGTKCRVILARHLVFAMIILIEFFLTNQILEYKFCETGVPPALTIREPPRERDYSY